MKVYYYPSKKMHYKKWGYWLAVSISLIATTWSCTPTKCVLCDIDNSVLYNVELDEEGQKIAGKENFESFFAPVPIETGKKKADLYMVDCDKQKPYTKSKEELEQFIKNNMVRVDTSHVIRIATTSDADLPPRYISYDELSNISLCNRYRKPIKLEIRGMLGSRLDWNNENLYYPGYNGGTTFERNNFINHVMGFGTGGTNLIVGIEAAIIPRIMTFNNRHALGVGLLTGFWPVDGGLFIPVALHPRFTFNELSMPLWGKCNAWYLFGDLGTAVDASGDVDFLRDNWLSSWFAGGGVGIDLWKNKHHDLSFDLGYRYTSLGLLSNEDIQTCLEEAGALSTEIYAIRTAGQIFIRFGFTW